MITQHYRKYLEYRPKLQYIYDILVTPEQEKPSKSPEKGIFGPNSGLILQKISDLQAKIDDLIAKNSEFCSDFYQKYSEILASEALKSFEKQLKIRELIEKMQDTEGEIHSETAILLKNLRETWQNIENFFKNTVVFLLDKEFPDISDVSEQEKALEKLILMLEEDKVELEEKLAQSHDTLSPEEVAELTRELRNLTGLHEKALNLQYTKTDICNIVELRASETEQLLNDINSKLFKNLQEILDNQLVDVLYLMLSNVNNFNQESVLDHLKKTMSVLRLSFDSKKTNQASYTLKKENTISKDLLKKSLGAAEEIIRYRALVAVDVTNNLMQLFDEENTALAKVLDAVADGALKTEEEYQKHIKNVEKVTRADIQYTFTIWKKLYEKDFVRKLYKTIEKLINLIQASGIPANKNDLYGWLKQHVDILV